MKQIIDYFKSGFALIPIPRGQKGPIVSNWNHKENVITNNQQTSLLDDSNVVLANAYCTPEPTCAIDFDDLDKAKHWFKKNHIHIDRYIKADDAVHICSGRANRMYRLPNGALRTHVIKDQAQTILEFRCATREGLTVQDVLPPSIHPETSQPYTWGGRGNYQNIPMIPEDIHTLWKLKLIPLQNNTKPALSTLPESPKNVATLIGALDQVSSDCDYESYRNIVWAIKSTGWTVADEIALIWSQKALDRFNEETFNNLINSYSFNHNNPITVGTIFHLAKAEGQK